MVPKNLNICLSWISLLQWIGSIESYPSNFRKLQFLPPATSFTSRKDQFISSAKIPRNSRNYAGGNNFFSSGFSSFHTSGNSWRSNNGIHQASSFEHFQGPQINNHMTPDFSDGLSYPDPYLLTGAQAKRTASYLYSKELFFHNIPHERSLLYNQEQRVNNGLSPHKLGSIRLGFPWFRF